MTCGIILEPTRNELKIDDHSLKLDNTEKTNIKFNTLQQEFDLGYGQEIKTHTQSKKIFNANVHEVHGHRLWCCNKII